MSHELTRLCYIRELGLDNKKDIKLPNSVLDRFICGRYDEHHIEAQEFGECTPPLTCRFSKVNPNILAVADEDGGLLILNTYYPGIQAVQQDWLAHRNAVFDIDWMPQENKLLTASGDQTVVLWDVENEEKLSLFKGHTSSVKTARFGNDNKWVFATGARDGHIMLYDSRVKEKDGCTPPVNIIHNAHKSQSVISTYKKKKNNQETPQSVTALVFQDENTLISSGSVDGSIKVWDLRKTYTMLKTEAIPKHTFQYIGSSVRTHGFSSLVLDRSCTQLFASCMDNVIYKYDTAAFNKFPVAKYRGHKNTTFYIKTSISPDEEYLLSGSSDNLAYIWNISDPDAPPWMLQGHCGEVSAVEWSPADIGKVVTISDDSTVRVWRLDTRTVLAQTPPLGEMVGRVQRKHEIGISANVHGSNSAKKRAPSLTPKKGAMIPPSPVKQSPVLAKCMASLPGTRKTPCSNTKTGAQNSPSILSWFGKSSKPQPSPAKRTPKKLIITPKKQQSAGSDSAVMAGPSCSQNSASSTVKRKLYDADSPIKGHDSKKRRLDDDFFAGHVHDENSCDNFVVPPSPRQEHSGVLVNKMDNHPSGDNGKDSITPLKGFSSPARFHSPTTNLPNYVVDRLPRTPVSRKPEDATTPRTPNWLLQMKLHKNSASKEEAVSSNTESKVKRTPNSRKKQDNRHPKRSIMQYFSPNAEKSKKDSNS